MVGSDCQHARPATAPPAASRPFRHTRHRGSSSSGLLPAGSPAHPCCLAAAEEEGDTSGSGAGRQAAAAAGGHRPALLAQVRPVTGCAFLSGWWCVLSAGCCTLQWVPAGRPGDQVAGHSASVAPLSPTKLAANGTVSAPRDEGLRARGNAVEMKKAAGFFPASPSPAVEPCLSNLCSSTLWQWKLPAVWALGVFGEVGAQTASIVAVHGCRPALASPADWV